MNNLTCMTLVVLAALASLYPSKAPAQSVLDNINCGGGRATCNYVSTKSSGYLSCTCTATCLSCASAVPDVAATRSFEWGTYVNDFPCTLPISVSIVGGTDSWKTTTQSSVYVQNAVTTLLLPGGEQTSTQQDDCFDELVIDDPPIKGLC